MMYILSNGRKEIVNSSYVERFCLAEKEDAVLIVASYGSSRPPVTMGRYADRAEAMKALDALFWSLSRQEPSFEMPESSLFAAEVRKRDARTRRRGGS